MAGVELKHTTIDGDDSNSGNDWQDNEESVYASTMTAGGTRPTSRSGCKTKQESSLDPCQLGHHTPPVHLSSVEEHTFNIFDSHTVEQCLAYITRVDQMWKEIGHCPDKCKEKIFCLQMSLIENFKIFANGEHKEYELYLKKIDKLEKNIETVLTDLEELSDSQLKEMMLSEDCVDNVDENNLLIHRVAHLEKLYQNLCANREKYDEETSAVKLDFKRTFAQLGQPLLDHHQQLLNKKLLNSNDIQHLNQLLKPYQIELAQRQEQCKAIAKQITFLEKIIPIQLNCALRKDSLVEEFVFSHNNQIQLEQTLQVALESLEVMWQRLNQTVDRLSKMYLLFDISKEEKHSLFEPIKMLILDGVNTQQLEVLISKWTFDTGITMQEIQKIFETECQHYEQLKCQRMKEIIGNVRRQYRNLLEKCLVDPTTLQTNSEFHFLTIDMDLNDQLLQIHEEKMNMLRQYYDKYKEFFFLMEKWRELKLQMNECSHELQNAIMYRNRGAGLQQTLNRQRTIKKKLTQSMQQIETWLQQHSSVLTQSDLEDPLPFNLYHVDMSDLIAELNQEKTGSTITLEWDTSFLNNDNFESPFQNKI